ncbi:MAG: hypothetical protein ABIV48_13015, partial [Pyrinomonadaceae bacterium]
MQNYKILTKLVFLFLLLSFPIAAQEINSTIVFRNVTLIDMRNERSQPDMTIIVKGNRIAKIGKNLKIPKDAKVVDAKGKFLMPGLWDNYTFTLDA